MSEAGLMSPSPPPLAIFFALKAGLGEIGFLYYTIVYNDDALTIDMKRDSLERVVFGFILVPPPSHSNTK